MSPANYSLIAYFSGCIFQLSAGRTERHAHSMQPNPRGVLGLPFSLSFIGVDGLHKQRAT